MDLVLSIITSTIWSPIRSLFFEADQDPYWAYWFSSAAIASFIYCRRHGLRDGFLALRNDILPRNNEDWRVIRTDLILFPIIYMVLFILMVPFLVFTSESSVIVHNYLIGLFGSSPIGLWRSNLLRDGAMIVFALLALLTTDLAFTLTHVLFHKVPALWQFHKVHHAPKNLWFLTAYRGHPLNTLAYRLAEAALTGVVIGSFSYLLGLPAGIGSGAVYASFIIVARSAAGMFRHSRVWLHFGTSQLGVFLNTVFTTPAHHQIHHGSSPEHCDKNFGDLFSIWDWAMGTLVRPGVQRSFPLGLAAGDVGRCPDYTLKATLLDPLLDAWMILIRSGKDRQRYRAAETPSSPLSYEPANSYDLTDNASRKAGF